MLMTKERIKLIAQEIGFHACGIAAPQSSAEAEAKLKHWTEQGKHGEMKYLERYEKRKADFWSRFPNAKSIIVLGVNYYSSSDRHCEPATKTAGKEADLSAKYFGGRSNPRSEIASLQPNSVADPPRILVDTSVARNDVLTTGRVARYAWGRDYHQLISEKIEQFKEKLKQEISAEIYFESAVDTKPLFERSLAQRAGLGFIGKQTQLLSLQFGPWLFLSELITNLELEPDEPFHGSCGTCRLCIDECPTEAIEESGGIDARKCIAYLTIEHKTEIPEEFRTQIGDHVFGCDDCLSVCPYTAKQKETNWPELTAESGFGPELNLSALFDLTSNREHKEQFHHSAILRANRKQLLRNAAVVLGNKADRSVLPLLRRALLTVPSMVKTHIHWAIQEIEKRNSD